MVKEDLLNPNSETSSRIFLSFSLLPTDFQEISGFPKEILGPEEVKKMSIYFTDRQWNIFFPVHTCKKPIQIEHIS
jgi:hypothetical protein